MIKFRADENIKGIKVNSHETKAIAHADDITCLIEDVQSSKKIFQIVQLFSRISGLKLNKSKCEGMCLGSLRTSSDKPLGISWSNSPIRILGIFLSYDSKKVIELNFLNKLTLIQKLFRTWANRGLSLLGRITIAKTLAISQILFAASVIPIPNDMLMQFNSCIYKFIWNGGSEKIKRGVLNSDYTTGGLKMLDLGTMISSNRIIWVKRFFDPEIKSAWKLNIKDLFKPYGGFKFLCSTSNFNVDQIKNKNNIPQFYKEMLHCWKLISIPCDFLLWYSSTITMNGKSVFWYEEFTMRV